MVISSRHVRHHGEMKDHVDGEAEAHVVRLLASGCMHGVETCLKSQVWAVRHNDQKRKGAQLKQPYSY